jgi:Fe-Mn family superoxide dismutase
MRFENIIENKTQLELVQLDYKSSDLTPVISKNNFDYHYNTLSKGYVDKFNKKEGDPQWNKAGAFLHNLWWPQLMQPKTNNQPIGVSRTLIESKYDTWPYFRDQFNDTAISLQGSGWVYLAKTGEIKVIKNHAIKNDIVMVIDVWEHAYYIDYPADRKSYMNAIWRCINWSVVNDRLNLNS